MKSAFLKLKNNDLLKGLIVSIVMVLFVSIKDALGLGEIPTEWEFWKPELIKGAMAGVAYLSKNLFSNSDDKFLTKEV